MNRYTEKKPTQDVETAGKHDNDQRKSCKVHWKMLEKYNESAGKCENNQRRWCKNHRKMKEAGNTHWKWRKPVKMVQKAMEERSENGRKHVVKKCWTKHTENVRRGCRNCRKTWTRSEEIVQNPLENGARTSGKWRRRVKSRLQMQKDTENRGCRNCRKTW